MNVVERRSLFRTVAAGTIAGLAGCVTGSDGSDGAGDEPNETDGDGGTDGDSNESDGDSAVDEGVEPSTLERRAREFVERLDAGETDAAYELVTESFASQLPPGEMESFWETQIRPAGDLEGFAAVEFRGHRDDGLAVVVARGQFSEAAIRFEYAFAEGDIAEFVARPGGEWTPPSYADESALSERDLTLEAPDDCSIGATLTRPASDAGGPGIVLVHGSGDQDRDETAGANRTFKELAWGLATQGITSLRYDKRTVACDVDRTAATVDDIIVDDAVAAVERLRGTDGVDDVFVAGHSLGGKFAPLIAERSDAAGVIMLAPSGVPVHEAIVRQQRHVLTLDGNLSEADEDALADVAALAERIRTLDIGDDEVIDIAGGRGRPFWRTLQAYDHTATAAELDVPILLVQGGRDYLVTVEDDLAVWEDAIGDEPNVRIEVFDDLNHRFQPGTGQSSPAEWTAPENPVDERVVEAVADFVRDSR
ncbi:alpha/beta hydrolase [Halovivax limisalsi]|uniref:alpha/beta hydrolase n=1 Tax=Halovivax limisalsi TaxID=1453760 RepID=UPI001FFD7EFF|nr:alpha/beta family hydrolase [Halovivax limisalsi]